MSSKSSTFEERPPADPAREAFAHRLRSEGLSPEEWAARYAHTVGCSSLDTIRYSDASLDAWIQEMHRILRSPPLLEKLRAQYLTAEQRREIDEYEL